MIPLRNRPIVDYDVLRVHTVPIKIPNSAYLLRYVDLPRYLAVSSDRQYYRTLEDFADCRRAQSLMVCLSDTPLYTVTKHACVTDLFSDRPLKLGLCTRQILSSFVPQIMRLDAGK